MSERIFFLKDEDLNWNFDDKQNPFYALKVDDWNRNEYVDPFPCYAHDEKLVRREINWCESAVAVKYPPKWFILSHDFLGRTNGYANSNSQWVDDETNKKDGGHYKLDPYIVLAGKRIPLLPAMTRYLVSHEYGHIVDYNLRKCLDLKDDEFKKMYADMRGVDFDLKYGARNWHTNISEIIANDIRIIFTGREEEFWPHPCTHPMYHPKLIAWWYDQYDKYFDIDNKPLEPKAQ